MKNQTKETKSKVRTQIDEILAFHNQKLADAKKLRMANEEQVCYDCICNTSGGTLVLPDFHALAVDPKSDLTFSMEPGEKLDLLTQFDIKEINRNRKGLETAAKMKGVYGFNAVTFIKDVDVEFPVALRKETLFERGMKMKEEAGEARINLPANEFDKKLQDEIKKEEKYNNKLLQNANMTSGANRKTKDELEQEEIERL